jgi:nucleoside-diphosphate-sugar epimerase
VPSGTYNVSDDEPLTKAEYGHAVATALGVKDPRLVPQAVVKAMGKKVDPIARSQRVSNARFKAASGWAPTYPSAREGWRALVEDEEVSSRG